MTMITVFFIILLFVAFVLAGGRRLFHIHRSAKTRLVLSTIIYKNLKVKGEITMAEVLVKEFLKGTLSIVNHVTSEVIPATFATETFVSSDEGIVKVVVDPDDTSDTAVIDFQGIAVGTAELTIEVDATYVDPSSGTVTRHKTVKVTMTVTPGETETDLVVNFSAAAPIPTEPAA